MSPAPRAHAPGPSTALVVNPPGTPVATSGPAPEAITRWPTAPAELVVQAQQVRAITGQPAGTVLRRLLFMWLRIFVHETKANGKVERVNVRLPIPVPLVGALLRRQMPGQQALRAVAAASDAEDGRTALGRHLESWMGFELIRVESHDAATHKSELVVIGLD
ncbi:hypothetical protein DCC79_07845 [bacterium]|nr:hypothetical protein [Chloroflexi bacterium CFX6]RIL10503.1 MAG: hypothetical protein DCC79_07845 [bacterium]